MMKLLIVTHIPFWLEDLGSKTRVSELYSNLSRSFDITVFFLGSQKEFEHCRENHRDIRVINATDINPDGGFSKPWCSLYWKRPNQDHLARFNNFTKSEFFHIELYEYISFAHFAECSHNRSQSIQILDTHDLMSSRGAAFKRFGKRHHTNITQFEEYKIMDYFDLIITIQLEDYKKLSEALGAQKILYIPHVVQENILENSFKIRLNKEGSVKNIVFAGGYNGPNKDGIEWFINEVWPLVNMGNLKLNVYGTVCEFFKPDQFPETVQLHGRVETRILNDAFVTADICINPVYYGGGLKIKTIEYLSCGAPTVATREAIRGMAFQDGPLPLEVATSREEFGEKMLMIINDAALRKELSIASIFYVQDHFSRQITAPSIDSLAKLATAITHEADITDLV